MSLKRKADEQITPEIVDEIEKQSNVIDSKDIIENDLKDSGNEDSNKTTSFLSTGFSSYANTNPFASALSTSLNSNQNDNKSSSFSGFSSFASYTKNPFLTIDKPPSFSANPKGLTVETKETDNDIPASLITPSPNQQKHNPFSSTSPKHNPFVKIVDSKDVAWLERTTSSSSNTIISNKPSVSINNDLATTKSFFSTFKESANSNTTSDKPTVFPQWGSNTLKSEASDNKNDNENNDDNYNPEEEVDTAAPITKIYSLPDNVVVLTGEENEECILHIRTKLYRWVNKSQTNQSSESISDQSDTIGIPSSVAPLQSSQSTESSLIAGEWIEVGVGPLKILKTRTNEDSKSNSESDNRKYRLVMRREEKKGGHGTKLLLNVALKGYMTVSKQGEKAVRITCIHAEAEGKQPSPQTYVLKTKLNEEHEKLYDTLEECVSIARKSGY